MNDNTSNRQNDIRKQKKVILIVIASLIVFVIAYFAISAIDFDKLKGNDAPGGSGIIYFYDEELSKNIFQDEKYMEKDRTISYVNQAWGTGTTLLTDDDAVAAGPATNLIYHMLGYILTGNHEGYNSCFSEYYYENGGEPKGRFTQQKIYNITITEISVTDKTDNNGDVYKEYYYMLEYMIRHNNGSLRDDMGSDCIKAQYLVLSERFSNEILIDTMYTLNVIVK